MVKFLVSPFLHLFGSLSLSPAIPQEGSWPPWADTSVQTLWDSEGAPALPLPSHQGSFQLLWLLSIQGHLGLVRYL